MHEDGGQVNVVWELKGVNEELSQLPNLLDEMAEKANLSDRQKNKLRLIMEELLTNIIKYGKLSRAEEKNIFVFFKLVTAEITIVVKDRGQPFNILSDAPVAEKGRRTIGGWGLFLVKKEANEMFYAREEEFNVLTIIKKW